MLAGNDPFFEKKCVGRFTVIAPARRKRMQGFEVRLVKRINRVLVRRGKLFAERYHARVLRTPREVRNALRYILLDARHHAREPLARDWVDPYSSGLWFDGWDGPVRTNQPWMHKLVATPTPMDDAMASAGEGTPVSHAAADGR